MQIHVYLQSNVDILLIELYMAEHVVERILNLASHVHSYNYSEAQLGV